MVALGDAGPGPALELGIFGAGGLILPTGLRPGWLKQQTGTYDIGVSYLFFSDPMMFGCSSC